MKKKVRIEALFKDEYGIVNYQESIQFYNGTILEENEFISIPENDEYECDVIYDGVTIMSLNNKSNRNTYIEYSFAITNVDELSQVMPISLIEYS